jgi:lambda family phage portal protein
MKMSILDRVKRIFAGKPEPRRVWNKGYDQYGASTTKKVLRGWSTKAGDPDEDITKNLPKLRERSRDLWMGVPLATGALRTIRTNVVGAGLIPNAMVRADIVGLSEEERIAWERRAESLWNYWSDSTECDIRRLHTMGTLQGLAFVSMLMNGDAFVLLPYVEEKGSMFGLRVRLIEGDRVMDPKTKPQGKDILGGVEVDDSGRPVAYYIASKHPGGSGSSNIEFQRVEVFGSKTGRRNILHLIDPERIEQRRGVPVLAPVIEALKQLGRYTEAELVAAVVSGFFTVFVKSSSPLDAFAQAFSESEQVDAGDSGTLELGNGAIIGLAPGEDIQIADPGRPNNNFEGFVTAICKQVGAALELPYEVLIKHFSSSYSASRGALLEAWKMFKARRSWLVSSMCQPIYEAFISEAVARGYLEAPGFFDDPLVRWAYTRAEWYGPSQGQLDPYKEVRAAKIRVDEGFSTRAKETAELSGGDFDLYMAQRAKEEQMRREAGLVTDTTANDAADDVVDEQEG